VLGAIQDPSPHPSSQVNSVHISPVYPSAHLPFGGHAPVFLSQSVEIPFLSKQCPQIFSSPASVFHNPFGANFSTGFTGGFSELTGVSSELAGVSSELTGGFSELTGGSSELTGVFTVADFLFSVLLSCEPVSAGSAVARVCPNTHISRKAPMINFILNMYFDITLCIC